MSVKVSLPCSMSFSEMEGSETHRHCPSCAHTVLNYSLLSPSEREAMLAQAKTQRVCAFGLAERLADGQVRLRTREELGQRALSWLRAKTRAASAVAAFGLAVQPSACEPEAAVEKAAQAVQARAPVQSQPAPADWATKVRKLEDTKLTSEAEEVLFDELEALMALGGYIDFE